MDDKTQNIKTNRFIIISYLIYIIFWETLIIVGTAYVVFWLNYSPWWWLLGVFLSASAYKPGRWRDLITGPDENS